jgi:hypothetical protein
MDDWGVLENDIVVEDLAVLAGRAGFTDTTVLPINLLGAREVPAGELARFARGHRLAEWWCEMAPHVLNEHYIFLYKGEPVPDTRGPGRLRALIEPRIEPGLETEGDEREPVVRAAVGERVRVPCVVRNVGDTLWLGEATEGPGKTRLGIYFRQPWNEETGRDWIRVPFDENVRPGDSIELEIELPPSDRAGEYLVELDLVAEDVTWFADAGSGTASFRLVVEP